jgi:hypothetical protein
MKTHKAKLVGLVAGGGTGMGLVGATTMLSAPTANLGGYAVAQIIAGSFGVGGPTLSVGLAAIGGPAVAGAVLAAGVGYGAYSIARWLFR